MPISEGDRVFFNRDEDIRDEDILEYIEKNPTRIRREWLQRPLEQGNYKGKSLLFMIAKAAVQGQPEALIALMLKRSTILRIDDMLKLTEKYPEIELVSQALLGRGGTTEQHPVTEFFKMRPDLLTPKVLEMLVEIETPKKVDRHRGFSYFFDTHLPIHTDPQYRMYSKNILTQLIAESTEQPDLLTNETLSAATKTDPNAGMSILWKIADIAVGKMLETYLPGSKPTYKLAQGNSTPLQTLIDKKPDLFTIDMLSAAPKSGLDAGKSVLWLITAAAAQGNSEPLQTLIDDKPDLFTIDMLSAAPTWRPDAGISVLQKMSPSIINQLIQRKCRDNPNYDNGSDESFYNILYNTKKSPSENAKDLLRSYAGEFIAPPNHLSLWAKFCWYPLQLYKRIFRNRHHVAMVKELLSNHHGATTNDLVNECLTVLESKGTVINPNGELAKRLTFLIRQCNPTDQPSLMGRLLASFSSWSVLSDTQQRTDNLVKEDLVHGDGPAAPPTAAQNPPPGSKRGHHKPPTNS